jgi:hypothetical protein
VFIFFPTAARHATPLCSFLDGCSSHSSSKIQGIAMRKSRKFLIGCPISCMSLQASVLKLWTEEESGRVPAGAAKEMAQALAAANAAAAKGEFQGPHPSITSAAGTLRETFRGWRTDVAS